MKIRQYSIFVMLAFLIVMPNLQAADLYEINQTESKIQFSVKHLGGRTVSGYFETFDVDLRIDEQIPENSSVDVIIQVKSINTGNSRRDSHLRNSDFFDAQTYPTIEFKSTAVDKMDENYLLRGNLTLRGVVKEIVFPFVPGGPFENESGESQFTAQGELRIKRQDYGMSFGIGEITVGGEVKINFSISAVQKTKD